LALATRNISTPKLEKTMGMMSEFKDFAMRGNVVDLAVGVVIGGAFGKIVTALVEKIFMPIVGIVTGGVDFSKQALTLAAAEGDKAAVVMGYGELLNAVFQFIIVAFCLFMVIKAMNSMKKTEEAAPAAPPAQEVLLREIRDALKAR
jgi:large conductance mechanosensitive channel